IAPSWIRTPSTEQQVEVDPHSAASYYQLGLRYLRNDEAEAAVAAQALRESPYQGFDLVDKSGQTAQMRCRLSLHPCVIDVPVPVHEYIAQGRQPAESLRECHRDDAMFSCLHDAINIAITGNTAYPGKHMLTEVCQRFHGLNDQIPHGKHISAVREECRLVHSNQPLYLSPRHCNISNIFSDPVPIEHQRLRERDPGNVYIPGIVD